METDFGHLFDYRKVDEETGKCVFNVCRSCEGPVLGHKAEVDYKHKIVLKTQRKKCNKPEIEEILSWISNMEGFKYSLEKLRPGMRRCEMCGKECLTSLELEIHMVSGHSKKSQEDSEVIHGIFELVSAIKQQNEVMKKAEDKKSGNSGARIISCSSRTRL